MCGYLSYNGKFRDRGVFFLFLFFMFIFLKEDHLKNGDISIYTNKIRQAVVLRRGQACV